MAEKKDTLDIAALCLSIIAIIISIMSPFLTYKYLQNDVRIQQIKARSIRAFSTGEISSRNEDEGVIKLHAARNYQIKNEGELPVGGVELVLQYRGNKEKPFDNVTVHTNPARKMKLEPDDDSLIVTFEMPIVPGDTVDVILEQNKTIHDPRNDEIPINNIIAEWIRSEASPPIPIPKQIHPKIEVGGEGGDSCEKG